MDFAKLSVWRQGITRGVAVSLGMFALLNLVAGALHPGFDANHLWIDLRSLPDIVAQAMTAIGGVAMLAVALCPDVVGRARLAITVTLALFAGIALSNTVTFYALWVHGRITPGVPIPFSLLVAAMLVLLLRAPRPRSTRTSHLTMAATACAMFGLLALAQMLCFGKTDYRRPADAIVVFGCRAYADGSPSDALADRVRTACELYHQGYADRLIFSGGPGDGAYHETDAMRMMAERLGVPADAILTDTQGLNTQHTVDNTIPIFETHGYNRILTVSHFYHLPRVKMAYQRAGVEVYTVPAKERYTLTQLPYLMAREVAAWWVYYVRPVV